MILTNSLRRFSTSAANRSRLDEWLGDLVARTRDEPRRLRPTVAALADLIGGTAELRMLAESMFDERPSGSSTPTPCRRRRGLATGRI